MKSYIRALGAAASGLLIIAATAAPVRASHLDTLDAANQKCRDTIAKSLGKTVKSATKVSATCHKGRNSGSVDAGVNCNNLAPGPSGADPKGKFAKAQQKLKDSLASACTAAGADRSVLDEFTTCPEPCGTSEGIANPMTNFADLGECLACVAGDIAMTAHSSILGSPATVPLATVEQTCHSTIAKMYDKRLTTILKNRSKCQKGEDKAHEYEIETCATSDPKDKILGATTRAEAAVDTSCAGANLTAVGSCDDTDLIGLKNCLKSDTDTAGAVAFTTSYELESTVCPVALRSKISAGYGPDGYQSRTSLELGWSGLSQDADLPDGYFINSAVTCAGTEAGACGDCTIDGLTNGLQYDSFLRCSNDFGVRCNTLFGPDPACGGLPCVYVLGPPLPLQAANNPTCTINALTDDISGTVNPDTGSSSLKISLRAKTHTGGTVTLTHPCPVCVGDVTARDGVKEGVCRGGAKEGQACDVDAFDATFAPESKGEGLALDCPPSPTTNISTSGLPIPFAFTTGVTQLNAETKCDSPLGALDCACAVCSLNPIQPCRNNAECATLGTCTALNVCEFDPLVACTDDTDCAVAKGTCNQRGTFGVARQPNQCNLMTDCTDVGGGKAECQPPGDLNTAFFCDGVARANGNGFIACTSNGDCLNSECDDTTPAPDGCGFCTTTQPKPCFLPPIVGTGEADTENPLLVSTFCLPPTTNTSINGAAGLPGPARVAADMTVHLTYY